MKLCRTRLLVVLTFLTGPTLAVTSVRANLHHPAALPCQRNCPGLIRWTVYNRLDDILAQCDKTSCSSKEGFNISHDQYLNGDLTLSISAADYSKRTWYICSCKGKDICEVRLSIETLISSVQKRPGEDLLLDLPISDPVELIYNSRESVGSSRHQICMVEEAVLRCNPEYIQRASLNHTVINLREVKPSDSGVYIIQDVQYKDIIHIYTVTVEEDQIEAGGRQEGAVPLWGIGVTVAVMLFVLVLVLVVGYLLWRKLKLKVKRKQKSIKSVSGAELKELIEKQSHERCLVRRTGQILQRSYSDSYLILFMMNDYSHEEQHDGGERTAQSWWTCSYPRTAVGQRAVRAQKVLG